MYTKTAAKFPPITRSAIEMKSFILQSEQRRIFSATVFSSIEVAVYIITFNCLKLDYTNIISYIILECQFPWQFPSRWGHCNCYCQPSLWRCSLPVSCNWMTGKRWHSNCTRLQSQRRRCSRKMPLYRLRKCFSSIDTLMKKYYCDSIIT